MSATYSELVTKLENKTYHWKDIAALLRLANSENRRDSRIIVYYGSELIEKHSFGLGSEVWDFMEQVAIAAMDIGDKKTAQNYITRLRNKFGNRVRVLRLTGLFHESNKDFDQAKKIYDDLLAKEPTDTVAMKRKIAIAKQEQSPSRVVELLNEYLSVFMSDTDAWGELADVYLSLQQYSHACYCYEEIILAFPQNYHFYVKYAEIKYSMGGATNLTEALRYYSLALELSKENNLRAYYGLIMSFNALASFRGKEFSKETLEVVTWAVAQIKQFYQNSQPNKLPFVNNWLKEMQFTENT